MTMEVENDFVASFPSLFLASRVACIILKFGQNLRHKVELRTKITNSFAPSSQRAVRLRASSEPNRTSGRTKQLRVKHFPEAAIEHQNHAWYIDHLLDDLSDHAKLPDLSLKAVASDDRLLCGASQEEIIGFIAENTTWDAAAYLFDSTTLLIEKLETIYAAAHNDPCGQPLDTNPRRLKNGKLIANLIHLLRCLQQYLLQILVHKGRAALDRLGQYWLNRAQHQEEGDDHCIKEWPSGQPPLSTTWPWTIRPSLMVLWGVCWMFYPYEQNNWDPPRMRQQPDQSNFVFVGNWPQNVPMLDNQQASNVPAFPGPSGGMATTRPAELIENPYEDGVAQYFLNRLSQPIGDLVLAPGFGPPIRQAPEASQLAHAPRASTRSLNPRWDAEAYSTPPTNTYRGTRLDPQRDGGEVLTPDFSGSNLAYPSYVSDASHSAYIEETPQALHLCQNPSMIVPTVQISRVSDRTFPLGGTPVPFGLRTPYSRSNSTDFLSQNMDTKHIYPLSPPSDAHLPEFKPIHLVRPERMRSEEVHSGSHREAARQLLGRQRGTTTIKRERAPPRNDDDKIYCDHEECIGNNVTFKRPCEWNKHMDKHDRPYKCQEPGCEANQGFTYSGGLLRHEREVHKKHLSMRQPLFCPFSNCNRNAGTGFTRRENLEEHKRRRHQGQPEPISDSIETSTSPTPTTPEMITDSRKRKRLSEGSELDGGYDHDETSNFESKNQRLIKRLEEEVSRCHKVIDEQSRELVHLRSLLQQRSRLQAPNPETT